MPVITLMPSGRIIEADHGEYLLDAIENAGVPVQQHCGNMAVCGWCRMAILQGAPHLSEPERAELLLMEREIFAPNERASCQTRVLGDVMVTTTYW